MMMKRRLLFSFLLWLWVLLLLLLLLVSNDKSDSLVSAAAAAETTAALRRSSFANSNSNNTTTANNAQRAFIVGGSTAPANSYPYFAIPDSSNPLCGAFLIHPEFVLTAAHCQAFFHDTLLVGVYELGGNAGSDNDGVEQRQVVQHFIHPLFDTHFPTTGNYNHDVLVLRLHHPIHSILPARLGSVPQSGDTVRACGFGGTDAKKMSSSTTLKHVELTIRPDDECDQVYNSNAVGYVLYRNENMLCAAAANSDTCDGDSGGPLVSSSSGGVVVGITSWGLGCARPEYPGVYTQLDTYRAWINGIVCQHQTVVGGSSIACPLSDEDRGDDDSCSGGYLLFRTCKEDRTDSWF